MTYEEIKAYNENQANIDEKRFQKAVVINEKIQDAADRKERAQYNTNYMNKHNLHINNGNNGATVWSKGGKKSKKRRSSRRRKAKTCKNKRRMHRKK